MARREVQRVRVTVPSFEVPVRRMVVVRPPIDELIRPAMALQPVDLVRPDDLVHLTFSFHNLRLVRARTGPPTVVRADAGRPAFLTVDCKAQHITERALFEKAENYPVKDPPPPAGLPAGTAPPKDPDAGVTVSIPDPPPAPPVFASIAGSSRLVFRVADQRIPYTTEGLLTAISQLDLSVAPQALPPAPRRFANFDDLWVSDLIELGPVLRAANGPVRSGRSHVEVGEGPTRVTGELIAAGRLRAAAADVEYRFGTEAALSALEGATLGSRLGIVGKIDLRPIERLRVKPPVPDHPPAETHTALELPWRLVISPNDRGAFAHSPVAVEHEGRFELWHTRLGVRGTGKDGTPLVDERRKDLRNVRAIWARDYEGLTNPPHGFEMPPVATSFPDAHGSDDGLPPQVRTPLNSRDRMMLVHETANFHLVRNRTDDWVPEAVPTNRLMLTALGGWLDSRVQFPTLPDGGLTIEEWKHRAALGRDHEVKVVYAGFLMPFGHRASLVKITERKIKPGVGGEAAYLFQRMFLIVREPERKFRTDSTKLPDDRRLDMVMPLGTVRILTSVTPPLDPPTNLVGYGGLVFQPSVAGSRFDFKLVAVDLEGNVVEFAAPLVFMERDHNDPGAILDEALHVYNTHTTVDREFDLRGQRMAYAESKAADDTALATQSLTFQVVTAPFLASRSQDEPRFEPVLEEARAVIPAMSALAGAATPTRLAYPQQFATKGFAGNAAEVFLKALDTPAFGFAGQGDRSGGFATPGLNVKGLSRLTGPVGGDLDKAIDSPGAFSVGEFFDGISAKLFGLIPLKDLFGALGFSPDRVPTFVAQTLDVATTLKQNLERVRNAAQAQAAQLGGAATQLKNDVDALLADLGALLSDPANPPDLAAGLNAIAGDLDPFIAAVEGATALPQAQRQQLAGVAQRVKDQLENAAAVTAAAQALVAFARGLKLPEVITARLDWSTEIDPWPSAGSGAIFKPVGQGRITLAVEVQAPTTPGKQPSAMASCSISPFDLNLIAPVNFIILHFETIEFLLAAGKKPDVNVKFREGNGIEFAGPLSFVNTLKDIIPFDGFSDPPYLDVTSEGINAGFDLAIPDLAVGVFALTNIAVGANLRVPFVDESIETAFNFSTRENPFRLQVALFAGGGFFGITITPAGVRVLEASFEFGAAISINLGVASGGVSIMAGVYFRLEMDAGQTKAQLTGYFRLRGEVDVLGLISASIELYLELTYETSTGKAVGRATLTIEVEVLFLSFSVQISCEKKFAGANGDPTFVEVMGAPPGEPRPWDAYCLAFADD
ncbi:MAG TPA: hypothetical protein VMZ73_01980 [Acidimicrobiales bacterium]|nr:hypothetical protein [Acidimicrobiales bacterium]